jgi:hypothetical protein
MKPSLLILALATLIGFGLGWVIKPAADPAAAPLAAAGPSRQPVDPATPADHPQTPPSAVPTPPVVPPLAPPNTDRNTDPAARNEKIINAKNAAKMQRLAEAMGLSDEQQVALQKILLENQKSFAAKEAADPPSGPQASLDCLAASGAALEAALGSLFTPEQSTAFAELRKRERDNRLEAATQRDLGNLAAITDLSTDQRNQIHEQFSNSTAAEMDAIPAALALVLDSSVLPLGAQTPSAQSVQTLRQIAETQDINDPMAMHAKIIENLRRKSDQRLALLTPILTPAQLAQYQAAIAEQRAIQDIMVPPPR